MSSVTDKGRSSSVEEKEEEGGALPLSLYPHLSLSLAHPLAPSLSCPQCRTQDTVALQGAETLSAPSSVSTINVTETQPNS